MTRYGLDAVHRERHRARGPLDEEGLKRLVDEGASIADIAVAVDRSKATVRHWLTRFGLRTTNGRGRRTKEQARTAKDAGLIEARMDCRRHGEAPFWLDGRGCYRCKRCRSEAVTKRRRKMKETLVREAGGACILCGYSCSMRALHFHHVDPASKRLELNAKGIALALDTLRAEAQKCVLLCSNCHAEVEDGRVLEPATARTERSSATAIVHDPG